MKYYRSTAIIAAAIAIVGVSSSATAKEKIPRKFVEVVQGVQYDGEYSPPVGRPADPDYSETGRVSYVPEWKRQIPILVEPEPIYITEDELAAQQQSQERVQAQAQVIRENQAQQGYNAGAYGYGSQTLTPTQPSLVNTGLPNDVETQQEQLQALPSAGSATGVNAPAVYGALPGASNSAVGNGATTIITGGN